MTNDKKLNKDLQHLAENIRATRQLELDHSSYGFVPHFKKKLNFVDYFAQIAENKSVNWKSVWNYMAYVNGIYAAVQNDVQGVPGNIVFCEKAAMIFNLLQRGQVNSLEKIGLLCF